MIINGNAEEELKKIDTDSVDAAFFDPPYQFTQHKIDKTEFSKEEILKELKRIVKHNGFIMYYGMQPTLTDWNTISNKLFKYVQEFICYKRVGTNFLNPIVRHHENLMLYRNAKDSKDKRSRKINKVYRPYTDVVQSIEEFKEASSIIRDLQTLKRVLKSNELLGSAIKYFMKDSESYTFKSKVNDNLVVRDKELKFSSKDNSIIQTLLIGYKPKSVVSFKQHNLTKFSSKKNSASDHNYDHPTVKSTVEAKYFLSLITNEGDVVIDPFMGTGTTGVACKMLNRNFIGIELMEEYFNISKERLEKDYEDDYELVKN